MGRRLTGKERKKINENKERKRREMKKNSGEWCNKDE